jgi:hypothetical protein
MAGRNGAGVFTVTNPDFISGTVISSSEVDANFSDIATGITQSIAVDGQTTITANLPMNSKKFTGLTTGSAAGDSLNLGQAQAEAYIWCGTMTGTADAGVLTPSPAITAYAAGQRFAWKASASVNTGAMTIAISGLSTIAAQRDRTALVAGDHAADDIYMGILDTTSTIQVMKFTNSSGDVVGPASSTDNVWVRFDSTTGKLIQDGTWAEDDSGNVVAGGTLSLADKTLSRPKIIDYGETVNAIGSTGGGTQDIDLELGNVVSATVDTSTNTFTFSNPPATGVAGSFTLFLTNGGSQTVNWPASVDWAGGTAPTLTTAGVDILTFTTIDAGTIWYGFAAGLDMQ